MSNSATPWPVACQAPLFMGFPWQECWSRLPFPFSGNLPDPRIEPVSPALAGRFLPLSHHRSLLKYIWNTKDLEEPNHTCSYNVDLESVC